MFCSKCGAKAEDGSRFCPSCGAVLDENGGQGQEMPQPEEGNQTENVVQASSYDQYGDQGGYGQKTGYMEGGTNRNIALCIVLSIITCGIYSLYWMYVLNNELNQMSGDTGDTSGGMVILFSIITCGIYGWYWVYKMGGKVDAIKQRMGLKGTDSPILFLILAILGLAIVDFALMQDTINNAAS